MVINKSDENGQSPFASATQLASQQGSPHVGTVAFDFHSYSQPKAARQWWKSSRVLLCALGLSVRRLWAPAAALDEIGGCCVNVPMGR